MRFIGKWLTPAFRGALGGHWSIVLANYLEFAAELTEKGKECMSISMKSGLV